METPLSEIDAIEPQKNRAYPNENRMKPARRQPPTLPGAISINTGEGDGAEPRGRRGPVCKTMGAKREARQTVV